MEPKLNKIKVLVPFYNPGEFLTTCINTLLTQDYSNYEVLFIDDCSTDGSYDKIPACTIKMDDAGKPVYDDKGQPIIVDTHPILKVTKCLNVLAWRSSVRSTALRNIHNGVVNFCTDPDDIVVLLDGDDCLLNKHVFSYINDYYNQNDPWIMYGSSIWTDGRKCCSSPYLEEEFKNLRKAPFRVSHIRTFRAGVYHEIGKQDPEFNCMKDNKGEFYKSAYDVCMFLAMLEIAGFEKVKHNSKPLYSYNRQNPISDDKVDQNLQWSIHAEILKKTPFKRVKDYKTGELY